MKRYILILLALVAMLPSALTTNAQTAETIDFDAAAKDAVLSPLIDAANASCPINIGEGMSLTSVKLDGGKVYFIIPSTQSKETIKMMGDMSKVIAPVMVKTFNGYNNTKELLNACRTSKTEVIFLLSSAENAFTASFVADWK